MKSTLCASLCGIFAGLAATLFLFLLKAATEYREQHPALVYGLPLAGLMIGILYQHFSRELHLNTNLIIDEFHAPTRVIPLRMAPFILVSTLLTHLFGGSAGREGTVVQMGASLADQVSHYFKLSTEDRKKLLIAGAGAGFGAALGAPIAGIFFGMEFIRRRGIHFYGVWQCAVASLFAYGVGYFLRAPHTLFTPLAPFSEFYASAPSAWFGVEQNQFVNILFLISSFGLVSLSFGLVARFFIGFTHWIENAQKAISHSPLRLVLGGLILVALFQGFSLQDYEGLSLPLLQTVLHQPSSFWVPLIKLGLTAITLGSGFKGGEFIPLVVIGAALGSAFSFAHPASLELFSHLGFCAIFAAASQTPISCAIMGAELFGWQFAPVAMLGCFISAFAGGKTTLYSPISKEYYNFKTP